VLREREPMRPLPPPRYEDPAAQPPFEDVPLVSQRPPEQRMFVEAYRGVGSPRISLFVNRSLEGAGMARGNGDYLRPGEYDEVEARSIDYQAIETIMTDWIASNGQVTVISPTMVRQRLGDQQVKELQEGRPQALREVAEQLETDVLIQVQARPTKQTQRGLEVRIIAEALNTRGGESIGRAVVDVPPPLEKTQINEYTRFLARKLMDDMSENWRSAPPARPARDAAQPDGAPARPTSPSDGDR
jgi:hypothetical protein